MKHNLHSGNPLKKRIVAALLVASFMTALPMGADSNMMYRLTGQVEAYATSSTKKFDQNVLDDAKKKKQEAEQDLSDTKKEINGIKDNQSSVNSQIKSNKKSLSTVKAEIEQTKEDIVNKQAEIDQTNLELAEAQKKLNEEYESMKLRIAFMYENNQEESLVTTILEANGLAEMLVRLEYIADVYRSDRELMDAYQTTLHMVEETAEKLAAQMEDLVALQASYESKQADLESAIASLDKKSKDYKNQLATANQLKSQLEGEISGWAKIIREQEALAAGVDPNTYAGGGSGSAGFGSAAYLQDDSYNPGYATSVSPDDLVAYALQYVGNPYVWGGNSLTNGIDCSGFVHQVYKHFGISTPRYSQSFKSSGQPISFNNMKKGDVVVYPGHVAIYMGNGLIVEAQSSKTGITCNRSVRCHTITGIRRLL